MKGFGQLLLYFYRWRSGITGSALLGALLLVAGLLSSIASPPVAFTLTALAYSLLVVVPYMSAPPALRSLISSRQLTLMPGLGCTAGLVMFAMTLLVSVALPLLAWLFDVPGFGTQFALQAFIGASLYTGAMQQLLPSPHAYVLFSLVPFGVILFLSALGESLKPFAENLAIVSAVAVATLAMWAQQLRQLSHRRDYAAAFTPSHSEYSAHHTIQIPDSLLGRWQGSLSATASLLFAYPAAWPWRLLNIASYVLISPLLCAMAVMLMQPEDGRRVAISPVPVFLFMSLFCGIASCWGLGELGARARLLWLRLPGRRQQVWQRLERELGANFLVLASVLLVIAATVRLVAPGQPYLIHYTVLILTCSAYQTYLSLCARLARWPSLIQALLLLVSLVSIAGCIMYALLTTAAAVLVTLEVSLAALALVFRQVALWQFQAVDWLKVRHAVAKRVQHAA